VNKVVASELTYHTLTQERWKDFEKLFGERGACGGCWCMSWRLKRAVFEQQKGAANKRAMKKIVSSGEIPGLIAYVGDEPIAWCSVAPREVFPRLENARTLKRIDDKPVWSVVCFFIAKPYRRRGVSSLLLGAAVDYARRSGASIVEGYPFEPKQKLPDPFVWTGLVSSFEAAGFKEAARRSASRPIMRYYIK
jgi:GNAT superfamily N-acetyltransferase